jgi:predicted dehydrogenase
LVGSPPQRVSATGGNYLQPQIADVTVTSVLFETGARAHIFVSWLHPFKEQRLVVIGSKKMASFDDVAKELIVYDQHVDFQGGEPIPVRGPGERVAYAQDEPLKVECSAFLEAVASRKPPKTDGRAGLDVLEVLEAAQRSLAADGVPVSLPLPYGRGR